MKNLLRYIVGIIVSIVVMACSGGFNQNNANELLQKENLTAEDYSKLIELYDVGMDDAIKASSLNPEEITPAIHEEMLTIYAIGMRLSKDESNLDEFQKQEFERINKKGTEKFEENK